MLTKCANPKCNAQFRYLHEGKLFIVDRPTARGGGYRWQQSTTEPQTSDYYDYYWLCSACSRSMVVVSDRWVHAQVLPAAYSAQNPEPGFS